MPASTRPAIDRAVALLDGWLETMRGPDGYGGPVAHWWQQSLLYTGAGRDWRYEGIIAGYLQLWERGGDERWLAKARRAGDDLLAGQLENGHYAASAFEINPAAGGTPHEAACDVGLLLLALALRKAGDAAWSAYAEAAERNLGRFYLQGLWDPTVHAFRDDLRQASFVPNKAATACEALFLLAELRGETELVERYALPTLDRILVHQQQGAGRLHGAIAQNSFGARVVEKYFPIYNARCVPALVRGYRWAADERYLAGALHTMGFIARWLGADGSLPTVVYPNLRANYYPSWIAALGDVLRATSELQPYGFEPQFEAVEERLLAGQDCSGGIQTAQGFAAQAGGKLGALPDPRDVLHVAGWCDKAFRYLATQASAEIRPEPGATFSTDCVFQGKRLRFVETSSLLEISGDGQVYYRWHKGAPWPELAGKEFWLR